MTVEQTFDFEKYSRNTKEFFQNMNRLKGRIDDDSIDNLDLKEF